MAFSECKVDGATDTAGRRRDLCIVEPGAADTLQESSNLQTVHTRFARARAAMNCQPQSEMSDQQLHVGPVTLLDKHVPMHTAQKHWKWADLIASFACLLPPVHGKTVKAAQTCTSACDVLHGHKSL